MQPRDEVAKMQQGDRYDKLPTCIQSVYTREQFKWLSQSEKDRLVETETNPEWIELT